MDQTSSSGLVERPIRSVRVVIPVLNEDQNIEPLILKIRTALGDRHVSVLIIDDGSADATRQVLRRLKQQESNVDYISLSRHFGKEASLMAGFSACPDDFDALITMDGDGQHSPSDLPRLISAAERENADLVIGIRADRSYQSKLHKLTSLMFYSLFNLLSSTSIPRGLGDFNLFRPVAVEALRSVHEHHLFLKGLVAWIGFAPITVECQTQPRRSGGGKFNLPRRFGLMVDGLFAFTDWPIKVWSLLGLLVSFSAFIYLLIVLIQTLIKGVDVPGYASLIIVVLGLGGCQLLSIGILGSYLARTYNESKSRPRFIVRESSLNSDEKSLLPPRDGPAMRHG